MPLPLKLGIHIIPVLIVFIEYLSISISLKIAQTMGDYMSLEFFGGLVRVGENISLQEIQILLLGVHLFCFLFALAYFYRVTLYGLGRDTFGSGSGSGQVTMWRLDQD